MPTDVNSLQIVPFLSIVLAKTMVSDWKHLFAERQGHAIEWGRERDAGFMNQQSNHGRYPPLVI